MRRTSKQNQALHLFFSLFAELLNEHGLDQRKFLKPGIEIPWTKESVKEQIWRPIQIAMFDKESTTELETREINQEFDVLNRNLAEKHGLHLPFPSIETLIQQKYEDHYQRITPRDDSD